MKDQPSLRTSPTPTQSYRGQERDNSIFEAWADFYEETPVNWSRQAIVFGN